MYPFINMFKPLYADLVQGPNPRMFALAMKDPFKSCEENNSNPNIGNYFNAFAEYAE
jgi:hypothetical protein